MTLPAWTQNYLLGNTVADWLRALFAALAFTGVFWLTRNLVVRRLAALAARTTMVADDALVELIRSLRKRYVLVLSLAMAGLWLEMPAGVNRALKAVIGLTLVLQGVGSGNRLVELWVSRYQARKGTVDRTSLTALTYGLRAVVWVVVLLVGLDLAGYSPKNLLTTLGIGGIAIALALQNVLGDLFAALSIVLDKPFVVGDAIAVDSFEGTVEHIGLKSTRVRSLDGEQVIMSNNDLLKSRVRNYTRRQGRRLVFKLSFPTDTPAAKLARVPVIVAEVVAAESRADLQRSHLMGPGPLGLEVETALLIANPDYTHAMDVRQAILLAVYDRLQREGIALARPLAPVTLPPA